MLLFGILKYVIINICNHILGIGGNKVKRVFILLLLAITSFSLIGCGINQSINIEDYPDHEEQMRTLSIEAKETDEKIKEMKARLENLSVLMEEREQILKGRLEEIERSKTKEIQKINCQTEEGF